MRNQRSTPQKLWSQGSSELATRIGGVVERPKGTGVEGCNNCENRSIRGPAFQHFRSTDWPFQFNSVDGHLQREQLNADVLTGRVQPRYEVWDEFQVKPCAENQSSLLFLLRV